MCFICKHTLNANLSNEQTNYFPLSIYSCIALFRDVICLYLFIALFSFLINSSSLDRCVTFLMLNYLLYKLIIHVVPSIILYDIVS